MRTDYRSEVAAAHGMSVEQWSSERMSPAQAKAAADKATAEYERREKAVDNMMTLGGHTY